jgi:MFS family permease
MSLSQINGLSSFYVLYILLSVGAGGISIIPVSVLISNWFEEKRGRAIGIAMTGGGLGSLILTPVVGSFVVSIGWRSTYVLSGLAVLILLTPVVLLMRNRPGEVGLLPDGTDPAVGARQTTLPPAVESSGVSLPHAVRTPAFWIVGLVWFLILLPLSGIGLHQVPFMTDMGLSVRMASLLAGLVGGMGILGGMTFGLLAERYSVRNVYSACYLMAAVGVSALLAASHLGAQFLGVYVLVYGIAAGGALALAPLLVGDLFGMKALGQIFGLLGVAATAGGAAGPIVAGLLFDWTRSYDLMFALALVLSVVAAVLILFVRPAREGS